MLRKNTSTAMVGFIFLGRPGSFRLFIYYNISLIYLIFPSISALYAPFVYLRRPLSRLTLNLKCQRASGNTDASAQLFLFFFFLGSFLKVFIHTQPWFWVKVLCIWARGLEMPLLLTDLFIISQDFPRERAEKQSEGDKVGRVSSARETF